MPFSLTRFGLSFERAALSLIACTVLALHVGVIGSHHWGTRSNHKVPLVIVAVNWDLALGGATTEARDYAADVVASILRPVGVGPSRIQAEDTKVATTETSHNPAAGAPIASELEARPYSSSPPNDQPARVLEERKAQFIRQRRRENRKSHARFRLRNWPLPTGNRLCQDPR